MADATPRVIATTATEWPVIVAGLGDSGRLREGKTAPDGSGRPTYSTGTILLQEGREPGEIRPVKSASINCLESGLFELGGKFRAEGKIWIVAYSDANGRSALSITAERLRPISEKPAPLKP
ncbi:MAG: hypothetical protein WC054_03985 [Candidatus Nanopelagicales bacterium]